MRHYTLGNNNQSKTYANFSSPLQIKAYIKIDLIICIKQ